MGQLCQATRTGSVELRHSDSQLLIDHHFGPWARASIFRVQTFLRVSYDLLVT